MLYIRCSEFVVIFENTLIISSLHLSLFIRVHHLIKFHLNQIILHVHLPHSPAGCSISLSPLPPSLRCHGDFFMRWTKPRLFNFSISCLVTSESKEAVTSAKKRNAQVSNRQPHPRSKKNWHLRPLDQRRPTVFLIWHPCQDPGTWRHFVCSKKTERIGNNIGERGVLPWCEQG